MPLLQVSKNCCQKFTQVNISSGKTYLIIFCLIWYMTSLTYPQYTYVANVLQTLVICHDVYSYSFKMLH